MTARSVALLLDLSLFSALASSPDGSDPDGGCLLQHRSPAVPVGAGTVPLGHGSGAGAGCWERGQVPLTPVLNLTRVPGLVGAVSTASIPDMLLPDATEDYPAFWSWERQIGFYYRADQAGRSRQAAFPAFIRFGQLAAQGAPYKVSAFTEDAVASVLATGLTVAPPGWRPYLQAVNPEALASGGAFAAAHPWQMDDFLGSVIAASHAGLYLKRTARGDFVQDYSPTGSQPRCKVEQILRRMFEQAPATVLRTNASLDGTTRAVKRVTIFDPVGQLVGSYTPRDGIKWFLAKRALAATNFYMANALHAAIHIYAGTVAAAMQNVLPKASLLHKALAPSTFSCVDLEVLTAASIIGKDGSVFGTGVYNVTDLGAFNAALRDFACHVAAAPLSETVACELPAGGRPQCPAPWWGAGAVEFIPAIQAWADAIAKASLVDPLSRLGLAKLPQQLAKTGLVTSRTPPLGLTTRKGLAAFLAKFILAASVFHGQHLSMREIFLTPLSLGGVFSTPLLQVLASPSPPATEAEALDMAYPQGTSPAEIGGVGTAYFVTSTAAQATPIGSGPYDLEGSRLLVALAKFRADLNAARAAVSSSLPKNGSGYAPLQLFPLEEIRTVGLTIPQGPSF